MGFLSLVESIDVPIDGSPGRLIRAPSIGLDFL